MAADPYEGMTDEQVLALAARHLQKVDSLPIGSTERNIKWAAYESAMAELQHRFMDHVIARLRERGQ